MQFSGDLCSFDGCLSLDDYLATRKDLETKFTSFSSVVKELTTRVTLLPIKRDIWKLPSHINVMDIPTTNKNNDLVKFIVGCFLRQKIRNVITSGFFLKNGNPVTSMESHVTCAFLAAEWKELFSFMGSYEVFLLLTNYSVFFLAGRCWIQLAGPPLWEQISRVSQSIQLESFSVSSLFYKVSFSQTFGFPSNHLFSKLLFINSKLGGEFIYKSIRNQTALILMHEMLRSCYPNWAFMTVDQEIYIRLNGGMIRMRYPKRLKTLHSILGKVLYFSNRVPYGFILETTAPLPSCYQQKYSNNHLNCLLSSNVSIQQVFTFVRICVRRLVPHSLLSSKHNWRVFYSYVWRLLSSSNRHGIRLDEMLCLFRLSDIKWLQVSGKPTNETAKFNSRLIGAVSSFLIRELIFPLLSHHFYLTDCSLPYHEPLYYRKPVYAAIVCNQLSQNYYSSIYARTVSQTKYRVAHLHFLPKITPESGRFSGVRPITNMKIIEQSRRIRATFCILQTCFRIQKEEHLGGIRWIAVENVGEGFGEITRMWSEKQQWIGSFDVLKCYDSIRFNVLLDIVNSSLEDYYRVIHFSTVSFSSRRIRHHVICVPISSDIISFFTSYSCQMGTVVSGSVVSNIYSRSTVVNGVKWYLSSFLVHIHNQFYRQVVGIPQGSILSYPLCNMYLREFEKRVLSPLLSQTFGVTFIRFVDDYIYITHDHNALSIINGHLGKDIDNNYGIRIKGNYQHFINIRSGKISYSSHVAPWCGYTIDSKRKQIITNFSKYSHFRNVGVKNRIDCSAFSSIQHTLILTLYARLHPCRLAPNISTENVRVLVYSNVLFAVKRVLHDYHVSNSSYMKQLVFITVILVSQSVHISFDEIQWLVFHAYLRVIRNSPSYGFMTDFLYRKVMHSDLRDELFPVTQHSSIQSIL